MTTLPGFNISILRQRTFGQPNEPIAINGRVSGFGFGLLAFVRVFLEGPTHNPEVRNFDTISSPLGDYSVSVLAEKDGRYTIYAQASPEPFFLGPPLLESARPPLVIGTPVDGQVEQNIDGRLERVAQPPPTDVEVSTPITFAPRIEVPAVGGAPGPRVVAPVAAPALGAPPDVGAPPAAVTIIQPGVTEPAGSPLEEPALVGGAITVVEVE